MFNLVNIAYASGPTFSSVLSKAVENIVNPLIQLAFAVATLVFLFGIFELITHSNDPEAHKKGQQHILWGVVGMFIMFSAFGIIRLIITTIGADTL